MTWSNLRFKSQRSYGFLITKELIFGLQILDLKDHFSASLKQYFVSLKLQLYLQMSVVQAERAIS